MKRLCVFYKNAYLWDTKPVEWIVCKECQKKVSKGRLVELLAKASAEHAEHWSRE